MKHFVLATNCTTREQDAAFYKLLRERWPHLGWWHQVSETWLLVDLSDALTAVAVRDAAQEVFPGIVLWVFQVEPVRGQWAGFSQPSDGTWILETWDR